MADVGTSRFLTIKDVVAETSLSCATIYRMMAKGQFPDRLRLSPNRVGWTETAIEAWKAGRAQSPPI